MANRYIKGLNKDTAPVDQIDGSWRHAKNVVMNPIKGGISNEKGFTFNEEDHKLNLNYNPGTEGPDGWAATGFDIEAASPAATENAPKWTDFSDNTAISAQRSAERIIGKIEISFNRVILFTTKKQTTIPDDRWEEGVGQDHAIYLLNNDGKLQLVFRTTNAGKTLQTQGDFNFLSWVSLQANGTNSFSAVDEEVTGAIVNNTNLSYTINADLNFNVEHPIQGTYKINSSGELVIYWTDDFNPPRSLNVTRQLDTANYTIVTDPDSDVTLDSVNDPNDFHYYANHIYGKLLWNSTNNEFSKNKDYIGRLNLFPSSGPVPHINFKTINSGGGLVTGVYQLALAYADVNLTRTNYLTVSNPVYITEEPEEVRPIERYDGANAGIQTGKSISWQITNINTDYDFLRPVIIRTINGTEEAFQLRDKAIKFNSTIDYITYTGLESSSSGTVTDIMVDTVSYDTAKTINQLDNVLYLGNLTGSKDLGFQKYANSIRLQATTETIPFFDPFETSSDNLNFGYSLETKPFLEDTDEPIFDPTFYGIQRGYRSSLYNVMKKGYMRDEVYAFYIAFIMNDGTMSYAYHIPGREALTKTIGDEADKSFTAVDISELDKILGDHEPEQLDGWLANDNCGVGDGNYSQAWKSIPIYLTDRSLYNLSGGEGRVFHFYECSDIGGSNGMNYWQNANEFYPSTDNYDIWDNNGDTGNSLRGQNVRHHHFPSNESDIFGMFGTGTDNTESIGVNVGETAMTDSYVDSFKEVEQTATWTGMYPGTWNQEWWANWTDEDNITNTGLPQPGDGTQKTIILADGGQDYAVAPVWNGPTPPEGACIYCEIAAGGPSGNILPDQGTDGNGVDIGTNCDAWFYGKVSDNTNFSGGIKVEIGPGFNDCGCDPANIWEDDGINPCGIPENVLWVSQIGAVADAMGWDEEGGIDGLHPNCGCAGGGILEGQDLNNLNTTTAGFGGDIGDREATTQFSGTCRWKITTEQGNVGIYGAEQGWDPYDGSHTSYNMQILGFHLDNIHIPEDIKDKVQGFRIYYAKREHHDRRILGQSLAVPMRQLNRVELGACQDSAFIDTEDAQDIISGQDNLELQSFWVSEGFTRNKPSMFPATGTCTGEEFSSLCSWEGINFHDFYMLNRKHSLAHSTHFKMEYMWIANSFWGKDKPKLNETSYAGDTITGIQYPTVQYEDDGNGNLVETGSPWDAVLCATKDMRTSAHIDYEFANPLSPIMGFLGDFQGNETPDGAIAMLGKHGGILHIPIKENAKTYLRGDSIYKGASDIGFGYDIYNIRGESCMAFQTVNNRGLVPIYEGDTANGGVNSQSTYNTMWSGFQCTNTDWDGVNGGEDFPRMKWSGDNYAPGAFGQRAALWQTNLHAFKLDLYKNLDVNELVWTGYEVIGEEFQNLNAAEGTRGAYPGGIFGGDTFLCRYGFRTTHRSMFSVLNTQEKGGNKAPDYNHMHDISTLYTTIVESSDNINFRHSGNKSNQADAYFPKTPAQKLVELPTGLDLTYNPNDDTGHIRYNEDYSKLNTLKTTIPLPISFSDPDSFPTRIIRSVKADGTSKIDNYRLFLALQFKDLPKNKGDLISLAGVNNVLYMHMEDTLYATRGKETLELADGAEAFVGSGDIFEKDPEEVIQTYYGYGGTQSQFAGITTRYGYFFINYNDRKVFLLGNELSEVSSAGLEHWFKQNIPFGFEEYPGWNFSGPQTFGTFNLDNPFSNFGFTSTWDPKLKRILLTKKEIRPTKLFDYMLNQKDGFGWSLTYDPNNGTFTREPNLPDMMFPCFTPDTANEAIQSDLDNPFDLQSDDAFTNSIFFFDIPGNIADTLDGGTPGGWNGLYCNIGFLGDQSDSIAFSPNKICFNTPIANECNISVFELDADQLESNPSASYDPETNNCCLMFGQEFNAKLVKRTGWTVSYYPELQIWVSFHDFIPSVYILSGDTLMSGTSHDDKVYTHNTGDFGRFEYDLFSNQTSWAETENNTSNVFDTQQTTYESIFEFIHSESKNENKLFSSLGYVADVSTDILGQTANRHDPGFTSFYVYNTHQISGEIDLEYLTNIRRIGNDWKINKFRDLANLNVDNDGINNELINMFNIQGMDKSINLEYIDVNKDETTQKKFVDKFLGISLKNSNISNNLVTLYSTEVGLRKYFR